MDASNALKLNEIKIECIVFCRNKDPTNITLTIGRQSINSQRTVKILDVTFDNNMTFENHVSNIFRSIHMNIRKIRLIRKYEAVKTLVQCTVTVRLDYCNSLLVYCGLPLKTIKKTAAGPEFRSTTHRQDLTTRIYFKYTYRSSLASCHKAMSIQVNGANLQNFT